MDSNWIAQHSLARAMRYFQQTNSGMPAQWSEPDLIANIATGKCKMEAEANGLDDDFDEASLTRAQAASRIAEIRLTHRLPFYFNEDDLKQSDQHATWRQNEYYGH